MSMLLPRSLFITCLLCLGMAGSYAQQDGLLLVNSNKHTQAFTRLFADSSFLQLKNSLGRAMEKNDKLAAAICLRQMGKICSQLTHFPQALEYLLQADKLFKEQGQDLMRAENLNDIGTLFQAYKQADLARQQYNEAFAIYSAAHHIAGIAGTHKRMGNWYVGRGKNRYDSAFWFYRLALNEYQGLNDNTGIAQVCGQLGNMHEDLKKYDSAWLYFERSQVLSRQQKDTPTLIAALNNMGDMYRKTGRYQEALPLTREALNLAQTTHELFHLGSSYRDMAKTFHLMGNNDSAYYYQRIGQAHAEDIYWRESGTQLAILKTLYDLEKKNVEIGQLKVVRNNTIAIVIIALLLLTLGVLVISRQRLRIKNAQLINEQEKQTYQAQKTLMELQEQGLKQDLEIRSRELSTHTLHIMQKNQFLERMHKQLDEMLKDDRRDQRKQLKQLQLQISQNFNHDHHWEEFNGIFDQVHQTFFQKLKEHCDTLTRTDLRLVALLKMNVSSADIATIMNISQDSVRVMRYRLRKKLNLQHGESLTMFIQSV